jgi:hypothetical protein
MSHEALVNDGLFWFVVLLTPLLVIFLCAVIAMPSEGRRAQIISSGLYHHPAPNKRWRTDWRHCVRPDTGGSSQTAAAPSVRLRGCARPGSYEHAASCGGFGWR